MSTSYDDILKNHDSWLASNSDYADYRAVGEETKPLPIMTLLILGICSFAALWFYLSSQGNQQTISREAYGAGWPLTLEGGTLICHAHKTITFKANGQEYSLNSQALSAGYPSINAILKRSSAGQMASTAELLHLGEHLCS